MPVEVEGSSNLAFVFVWGDDLLRLDEDELLELEEEELLDVDVLRDRRGSSFSCGSGTGVRCELPTSSGTRT